MNPLRRPHLLARLVGPVTFLALVLALPTTLAYGTLTLPIAHLLDDLDCRQ